MFQVTPLQLPWFWPAIQSAASWLVALCAIFLVIYGLWRFRNRLRALLQRFQDLEPSAELVDAKLTLEKLDRVHASRPRFLNALGQKNPLSSALVMTTNMERLRELLDNSELAFMQREGLLGTQQSQEASDQESMGWAVHNNFALFTAAERYLQGDLPAKQWDALMHRAARQGQLRSLRYIVITLQQQELASSSRQSLKRMAQTLADRMHCVSERFGLRLPVYLLVDGMQMLPGWKAFRDTLSPAECAAPWGFTLNGQNNSQQDSLQQTQHTFVERCKTRVLQSMLESEESDQAALRFSFAQSLEQLSPALLDLLQDLRSSRIADARIDLRGVFFSSISDPRPEQSPPKQGYFVEELFGELNRVTQSTPDLAPAQQRAQRLRHWTGGVALGAAILSLWVGPQLSSRNNRELQTELSDLIERIDQSSVNLGELSAKVWLETASRDQDLRSLAQQRPWSLGLGMSQLPVLKEVSSSLFLQLTLRHGIAPLWHHDQSRLHDLVSQASNWKLAEQQEVRERLFRYALLSSNASLLQPDPQGKTARRLAASIAGAWKSAGRFESQTQAMQVSTAYISYLAQQTELTMPANLSLIAQLGERLNGSDPVKHFALASIAKVNQDSPPLSLASIIDPKIAHNHGKVVGAAFTREGWEKSLKPRFEAFVEAYLQDRWMLGPTQQSRSERRHSVQRTLQHLYASAFVREWQAFLEPFTLRGMDLTTPRNPTLIALRDPTDSVFHRLTALLEEHLSLSVFSPSFRKGIKLAVHAKEEKERLSTPFAQLRQHFSPFLAFAPAVPADQDKLPSSRVASYQALLEVLVQGAQDPDRDLRVQQSLEQALELAALDTGDWGPWFEGVLGSPFRALLAESLAEQRAQKSEAWCALSQELRGALFDRYPFRAKAKQDAQLDALESLLHPSTGRLWAFVQENSALGLRRDQDTFVLANQSAKGQGSLSPRWIRFINAAWKSAHALFPQGVGQTQFSFSLRASATRSLQDFHVEIDEQRQHQSQLPRQSWSIRWPKMVAQPRTWIRVRHEGGLFEVERQGLWSLFRILESGRRERTRDAGVYSVSWPLNHHGKERLTLHLRPTAASAGMFDRGHALMRTLRSRHLQGAIPLFRHALPCS